MTISSAKHEVGSMPNILLVAMLLYKLLNFLSIIIIPSCKSSISYL